ncbi:hypothetical protein AYK26_02010 [Euryarchaeota archaeon SM23-78]|nr:MAG: hypothetical protein AYK26_02010 [Euryarchaeota archaeon SM23-78]MBW3000306.1 hypothetical protein [Candidatus Woesearchaeota archaeon]
MSEEQPQDEFFVRITNPNAFRRNLLEASKLTLSILKEIYRVRQIRKTKQEVMEGITKEIEESKILVQKIHELIPQHSKEDLQRMFPGIDLDKLIEEPPKPEPKPKPQPAPHLEVYGEQQLQPLPEQQPSQWAKELTTQPLETKPQPPPQQPPQELERPQEPEPKPEQEKQLSEIERLTQAFDEVQRRLQSL